MDCRVKPGNDDGTSPEQRRAQHAFLQPHPMIDF
jgi:hypothetical protein